MQKWVKIGIYAGCLVGFLGNCTPQTAQNASSGTENTGKAKQKELLFEDYIYEERIKTVQFYPTGTAATDVMNPPIVNMIQSSPLIIEFDDIGKEYCNYYAKLYHCNFNWTQSNYTDLQYVSEINETLIQNYNNSINTKVRYTHYSYTVPRVKVSGNYVLIVYRNGNTEDVVISRRFVAYSPFVEVNDSVIAAVKVQDRNTRQQVDCLLNYGGFDIPNPQDVRVVLRQNFRWDNAIILSEPQYIKYDRRQLDYAFFDSRNTFGGGNEFRYFDIRNLRVKGMNVATYLTSDTNNTVTLVQDKTRNTQTYSEQVDINGKYVIQRAESTDDRVEADYANVLFSLSVPPDFQGDVYVAGQLTDWQLRPNYKMTYNQEKGVYEIVLVLKQGFYNYQYCLLSNQKADWSYFEGDYSSTENFYDIIVYYRPPNQFNDIVIGYASVDYRGRN